MTILLTGFERFGNEPGNPTERIAKAFDGMLVHGERVVGAVLPVSFRRAPRMLADLMRRERPRLVLSLGLAPGRPIISVEAVALNVKHAERPDNDGEAPRDSPLIPGAPLAYRATIPVWRVVERLREAGVPARVSFHAGTFLCNAVFFTALHEARSIPGCRVGFIHVPYSEAEALALKKEAPFVPFELLKRAVEVAIKVSLEESVCAPS